MKVINYKHKHNNTTSNTTLTLADHGHLYGAVIEQNAAADADSALQLLVGDPDALGGLVRASLGVVGQGDLWRWERRGEEWGLLKEVKKVKYGRAGEDQDRGISGRANKQMLPAHNTML